GRSINCNEDDRRAFSAKLISFAGKGAKFHVRLAQHARVADHEAVPVHRHHNPALGGAGGASPRRVGSLARSHRPLCARGDAERGCAHPGSHHPGTHRCAGTIAGLTPLPATEGLQLDASVRAAKRYLPTFPAGYAVPEARHLLVVETCGLVETCGTTPPSSPRLDSPIATSHI